MYQMQEKGKSKSMVMEQAFDTIVAAQDHKVKVATLIDKAGNQSIQLLLSCGCFLVEHVLSQQEQNIAGKFPADSTLKYYEFCPQHLLTNQLN